MTAAIIEFFQRFIEDEYLLLFVMSAFPLLEMRSAVLLSAGIEGINHIAAFLVCGAGSAAVVAPLLAVLKPIMRAIFKIELLKPLAVKLDASLSERSKKVKAGMQRGKNAPYWAIFVFVAIPLPLTGVWMGSVIAAFIGLKFLKSTFFIILGNFAACAMLSILVTFAQDYIDLILVVFLVIMVVSTLSVWLKKRRKPVIVVEKLPEEESKQKESEPRVFYGPIDVYKDNE